MSDRQTSAGRQAQLGRADDLRASPPLFSSPALDRLTRVHPAVPVLLYGPVVVGLLAWALADGVGWAALPLLAAGYALWTLTEYWLHRVVFHFEPDHGIGLRLHYLIHGVHHDHPNDPRRLVMPPSASAPLAILFGLIFYALLSDATWQAVAAGFIGGYVAYDTLHYLVHHRVPRSHIGRSLRERHMRHHFQDDTRGFGVSAPYWDVVFGTAARRRTRWREVLR
ncbi:MAG TPA: sterol desaturase family protein [Solirubrobacteraceae bacterium]|nr:sterol desaturase family protein [Solirubrobacteraceae bacterium]